MSKGARPGAGQARGVTRLAFAAGVLVSLGAILLLGEISARLAWPRDVRAHFGEKGDRAAYRPDPELGADYRSYEDFRADNAARLAELGPLDGPAAGWLFLGNSFVQAPGMLADTARQARPATPIINLQRNIPVPLRAAQARQLLGAGFRPARIFFVLLPVDVLDIGRRPLSFVAVDDRGAIGTRLRPPEPPWDGFVSRSRLAAIAWIRSGRGDGDPGFDPRRVGEAPSPRVEADLSRILGHLAETSRRFGVPVTVVALPNREQVFGRSGFGFQDALKAMTARLGLDFYDARDILAGAADRRALFLPDWHFSERGNALVMEGLLEHLRAADTPAKTP